MQPFVIKAKHDRTLLTGTYYVALVGMLISSNSVTMDSESWLLVVFAFMKCRPTIKNVCKNGVTP